MTNKTIGDVKIAAANLIRANLDANSAKGDAWQTCMPEVLLDAAVGNLVRGHYGDAMTYLALFHERVSAGTQMIQVSRIVEHALSGLGYANRYTMDDALRLANISLNQKDQLIAELKTAAAKGASEAYAKVAEEVGRVGSIQHIACGQAQLAESAPRGAARGYVTVTRENVTTSVELEFTGIDGSHETVAASIVEIAEVLGTGELPDECGPVDVHNVHNGFDMLAQAQGR